MPKANITDKYLTGTRLRLRSIRNADGVQYKLGKKYGDNRGFSESISNIYLSQKEYEILRLCDGVEVTKTRYRIAAGSIDIYAGDNRPHLFSVEFTSESEAINYKPPDFVLDEVTSDQNYSGVALAIGEQ